MAQKHIEFDITIIGAGVVGLSIAKTLAEQGKLSVLVIEKNESFGQETSSRNSEVIHSGIFNHIDSIKYQFCVKGEKLLYDFCDQNKVWVNQCGKMIVSGKHEQNNFENFVHTLEEKEFNFDQDYPFNAIYLWSENNLCDESIEYIVSMMMEPYDDIITPLVNQMSSEEEKYFNIPTNRTVNDLKNILENKYTNILKIDFTKKESNQNFWFISKNKLEPRVANRFVEEGSNLEEPLAIARDIKKLYERLSNQKNILLIAKFLIENNDLRHIVRRAFLIEKFPYSEIQDNTIGSNLMPIDMLRFKLSFFGALKFDPKSDKWLRICMFQGAPLPTELKNIDDQWIYNSLN